MKKVKTAAEAVSLIKDGDALLFSGFYGRGTPQNIVDEIIDQGKKDLTVIANDGGHDMYGGARGVGTLLENHRVKKFICSWCARSAIVPELEQTGELELELVPQGSLAERIRAGGYGLGGIITQTGLNTIVEEKWGERVNLNGQEWLYQSPLRGNVAVIEAYKSDAFGNLVLRNTQRNFGTVMAYAADIVIASVVQPIVDCGCLDPEEVHVPGVLVDVLVQQDGLSDE